MNGRKKFGRILGAAGALTMVGALVMGPAIAQATGGDDNPNNPAFWEGWGPYDECTYDSPGYVDEDGDGNEAVFLDDDYALLVVKGGSDENQWPGKGNEVYFSPTAGTGYTAPLNPNTENNDLDTYGVSHWIVCMNYSPGITVTKTVVVEYDEYYLWDVDKSVLSQVEGTVIDAVTYQVVATRTGPSVVADSYTVRGTITVTNTGDGEVTIKDVQDTLNSSCEVTTPLPDDGLELEEGQSADFTYSCSVAGLPSGEAKNTATVEYTYKDDEDTKTGNGEGSKTFNYDTDAKVVMTLDETAMLTDTQNSSIDGPLEDGTETFEYTLDVPVGEECADFTNTATIFDLDEDILDSDSVTVTTCPPGTTPPPPPPVTESAPPVEQPPVEQPPVVETPEVVVLPPVPVEAPQSGALPQTGWTGTNLTILLGLAMMAAGGLAMGVTRRSAKS